MEYSINQLAKIASVSTRTLRYYDEINLLKPLRLNSSKYRIYGEDEVNRLQQILFYRELGFNLDRIKDILNNPNFDLEKALNNHLEALILKSQQINLLINNVEKTIKNVKGEIKMSNKEKFEGFKKNLINNNEKKYGKEIREKYGDDTVDKSNNKILNMTEEEYTNVEELSKKVNEAIKEAYNNGDPTGELAMNACELHKKWLSCYWDKYSKEAHIGLAQMYIADERFTEYYDNIGGEGCTQFLCEAIINYCK